FLKRLVFDKRIHGDRMQNQAIKPWRYVVSFALLYGLILHPFAMNTFLKRLVFDKRIHGDRMQNQAIKPWR
ncbi:hypothetical protein PSZ20_23290, partial [Shigella flexneri]|nr:hypothetical protein [Shigella flexneri]